MALGAVAFGAVLIASLRNGGETAETGAEFTGATARIERRDLTETSSESGTLGYSGKESVIARVNGTVTWLPSPGAEVGRGQRLLEVDDEPVLLMYGDVPAFRTLRSGIRDGVDVEQLERNLQAMGYDPYGQITVDGEYTSVTAAAVRRWQDDLGVRQTGRVGLGQVIFLPGPRRVAELKVSLGSTVGDASGGGGGDSALTGGSSEDGASGGGSSDGKSGGGEGSGPPPASEVMEVSSTHRTVTVDLEVDKQSLAREGAQVSVQLPDGSNTRGTIARVGQVASSPDAGGDAGSGSGSDTKATVPVTIELNGADKLGTRLDQAPVSVVFTTEVSRRVLAVPVTALVVLPGSGYAVQVVDEGRTRAVSVDTGSFANGYVEIEGKGLKPGLRVVNAQ